MQRVHFLRDVNGPTSSDRSEKKAWLHRPARHIRWCPISCLLQLFLPVREGNERGLRCMLSTSTASHHKRATVYDGQTEPPLRRRALPDGMQHRCRRDLNASHHHSGKDTCEERHFQVREGPERPEVGRSSDGRASEAALSPFVRREATRPHNTARTGLRGRNPVAAVLTQVGRKPGCAHYFHRFRLAAAPGSQAQQPGF